MNGADTERLGRVEASLLSLTARLNALAEGNFELGAEGFRVGSTRLLEKLISGDYHLYQRDAAGTESDLTGAKSIWAVPIHDTSPTGGYVLVYNASTGEIEWTVSSTPAAHVLATTAGLGPAHTTTGLTARQVLRATGATTAAFGAIQDADLPATIARDSELHTRLHAITDVLDHSATNWRVFYSDGSAHVIELALGADGTFLQSEGAAAAPTFGALQTTDIPDISATYQVVSEKDAASGYAGLEADSAVPVAHGGSGETTQQAAIDILTAVSGATNEHVLTKDTATGNAIFKVAAGGGASTALDNLASVAINTSLISDTDSTDDLGSAAKYWKDIYGDKLYLNATATLDGATAGKVNLTGNQQISGVLGVKGTVPNANYWANLSPSATVQFGSEMIGLRIFPSDPQMTAATAFLGISGYAAIKLNSGVNPTLRSAGLSFQAYPMAASGSGAHTVGKFVGAHVRAGSMAVGAGQSITCTDLWGLELEAPYLNEIISGVVTITNYVAADLAALNSALITNACQLRIGDCSGGTTSNRILELGPTPYLRLLGSGDWTPAANETPLYLAEGVTPTLRQVQWKAGDTLGAGDKVMVLV